MTLSADLRRIIADNVPVNTVCPHCQKQIEPEELVCPDSQIPADQNTWSILTARIIRRVLAHYLLTAMNMVNGASTEKLNEL